MGGTPDLSGRGSLAGIIDFYFGSVPGKNFSGSMFGIFEVSSVFWSGGYPEANWQVTPTDMQVAILCGPCGFPGGIRGGYPISISVWISWPWKIKFFRFSGFTTFGAISDHGWLIVRKSTLG